MKKITIDDLRRAFNIQNELTEEEIKNLPQITEEEWKKLIDLFELKQEKETN